NACGELVFAGRVDEQVKIRGFRIEPAEVEAVLVADPVVGQAGVGARGGQPGGRQVGGDLGGACWGVADGDALRGLLAQRLPEYMVPAVVVVLDALPLTVNQKVDRAALPAPDYAGRVGHRPASGPVEQLLCDLFAQVLHLERVGPDDSFFDLG